VEYLHHGHVRQARIRREVVLCAGAVNTPQLLMLSGIGAAADLRALGIPVVRDLPSVGRNLQDHLMAMLTVRCREPITLADAPTRRQLVRYHLRRTGLLSSNVAEAYAFARSDPTRPSVDLELVFVPGPFADEGFDPGLGHALSIGSVLLRPRSTGRVGLSSPDPLAAPRIDPRYLSDPDDDDRRVLLAGLALCERVLAAPALAGCVGEPLRPPVAPGAERRAVAMERHTQTLYHPVGTCRMGSDAGSVVDPELRVRGVGGLRVADASVMPVIVRGHPHAATVAIGRRAVELLVAARPESVGVSSGS
jgi:choline dehydrogenase-like flavoprotein